MLSVKANRYIQQYFKRFASATPILTAPFPINCEIIIVIPCHKEPNLLATLDALSKCDRPTNPVEVVIVVNQPESATSIIDDANRKTISDFSSWNTQKHSGLDFHLIELLHMPQKHAGVGLARKTGMDEALRRFAGQNSDGVIVCLDADCQVSPNYLKSIEQEFLHTNAGIGMMQYEHPFEEENDLGLKEGIVRYELFLRYYVEGLRQAGFPNAIHTIGSCMLAKASVYAKHGGMNKRKAGEDFYFLHKIVPHEPFITVKQATVYPSCRVSDRVPFGTGKAQGDWLNEGSKDYPSYDTEVFSILKQFIDAVPEFYNSKISEVMTQLPEALIDFVQTHSYEAKIALIKSNCSDIDQFQKQFFVWFDGFLCLKLVHFLRDHYLPNRPLLEAANQLIHQQFSDLSSLLYAYRRHDRQL